jgi:hypothetical protein
VLACSNQSSKQGAETASLNWQDQRLAEHPQAFGSRLCAQERNLNF